MLIKTLRVMLCLCGRGTLTKCRDTLYRIRLSKVFFYYICCHSFAFNGQGIKDEGKWLLNYILTVHYFAFIIFSCRQNRKSIQLSIILYCRFPNNFCTSYTPYCLVFNINDELCNNLTYLKKPNSIMRCL